MRVDPATFHFRLSIPVIFNNFNDSFEPLSNTVRRSTAEPSGANLAGATSARANNPKKKSQQQSTTESIERRKKIFRSLRLLLAAIIRRFLVILYSADQFAAAAGRRDELARFLPPLPCLLPWPNLPRTTHELRHDDLSLLPQQTDHFFFYGPTDPDDDGVLNQDHFSRSLRTHTHTHLLALWLLESALPLKAAPSNPRTELRDRRCQWVTLVPRDLRWEPVPDG